MKRLCRILLLSIFLLSGCTSKNNNELDTKKLDEYKSNVDILIRSAPETSTSQYFSVSYEMSTLPDGTHRYYLIIDNAVQCMYNVKIMAMEVGSDFDTSMAPSIGVLDDEKYNLIPSQVAIEEGYVKGLVLSGETLNNPIDVKLMVSWTDESNTLQMKEYLILHIEANQGSGE
ncbi:hypothetical protein [Anaerorhabdus sp.]|uniref:hypothetical protein n=1 Tax=Anaerorhabdus sp. TaxID=1872524 RepID=UPI002FCB2789